MSRIFIIICLALLLGIATNCGSGGRGGYLSSRTDCYEYWNGYYWDYYCETIYYKNSETGETIVWRPDYEGAVLKVSPMEFEARHPAYEMEIR